MQMVLEIRSARIRDREGAPRVLNAYVVCRLCPLLLGDGTTHRGSREQQQLRTDVCWGCPQPAFGFRHSVRATHGAAPCPA